MDDPSLGDHCRPVDAAAPPGVYRVVGRNGGVTLLRVGDGDGRRVHTGELVRVASVELDGYERADAPGGSTGVGNVARFCYWATRAFAAELAASPLATAAALAVLVVGATGGGPLALADPVAAALVVGGSLGLAAAGGGWLRS